MVRCCVCVFVGIDSAKNLNLFHTNKTALTFETRAKRRDVCVPVYRLQNQNPRRNAPTFGVIEMQYQNYVRNDLPK